MFLRQIACAAVIIAMSIGLVMAEEVKGRITKISGTKLTVESGKKGMTETKDYDIAKDCKVCKMEKKAKLELEGGLKNEVFQNIGKKGVPVILDVTDGKVNEIVVVAGKKKKDAN
jgi:hypothetical protein